MPSQIKAAQITIPNQLNLTAAWGPLEISAASKDDENKMAKCSVLAYTGGQLNLDRFPYPVVIDLAGVAVPTQTVPLLRDHDSQRIVGHSDSVGVSQQRIKITGLVSGTGEDPTQIVAMAKNGFPWQASVGMSVESREFVDPGQVVKVNGRNFPGPVIVARRTTLRECSFTAMGADVNSAISVAAKQKENAMTFEQWLQAKGFDTAVTATFSEQQMTSLRAMYDAEQTPPPPATPPAAPPPAVPPAAPRFAPPAPANQGTFADLQASAEQETVRRDGIQKLVRDSVTARPFLAAVLCPLGDRALAAGTSVEQVRREIQFEELKATQYGPAPTAHIPSQPELTEDVVAAAVCMTGRLADIKDHFDERTLEAAHKRWKHGLGIEELVVTAAQQHGFSGNNLKSTKAALQAAFAPLDIRAGEAGPSTYSLPNILSNVANKFLFMGFNAVDDAWRRISAIRSVSDFKQITTVGLTGSLIYQQLAPSGEIKHGDISEIVYNNQASTWASMLGISRTDLINDDLGALTGAARRLGRGGALALNNKFWTVFLNNTGSFFVSGNNNISTGVFSLTSLAAAETVFRNQTDPDGQPIGLPAAILLVPSALRIAALNAMNSTIVVGTATVPAPSANAFANAYDVVSSPYMSNTSYTGNSAVAFYLLANPNDLPVIETVFVNGVETPVVETADADFNTLGIAMRAWLDFGVQLQEHRAGVRSTGA